MRRRCDGDFKGDIGYQVVAGFSRSVDCDDTKNNLPAQLKVSPAAVVPQSMRCNRIILDLSFPVCEGVNIIQQVVNNATTLLLHPKAMDHLGFTMSCILGCMNHAPAEHSIDSSKYDVSNGFWRMVAAKGSTWNFTYVLPKEEGELIRLVV